MSMFKSPVIDDGLLWTESMYDLHISASGRAALERAIKKLEYFPSNQRLETNLKKFFSKNQVINTKNCSINN